MVRVSGSGVWRESMVTVPGRTASLGISISTVALPPPQGRVGKAGDRAARRGGQGPPFLGSGHPWSCPIKGTS